MISHLLTLFATLCALTAVRAAVFPMGGQGGVMTPLRSYLPLLNVLREPICHYGPPASVQYTVDDTAKLYACGSSSAPISSGDYGDLKRVELEPHKCNYLLFEVRNVKYASGIAATIATDYGLYVPVGKGSPSPRSKFIYTITAYAKWTMGSCVGFENEHHGDHNEAVYVHSLDGTNSAFDLLANSYGAHAIGVQDGNVYEHGLQCILVKLPFCV